MRNSLHVWFALSLAGPAAADVVRIEVKEREPFAGGRAFGRSGPYEKLAGTFHIEVDPDDPANARVTDLKLAPRNGRGKVEFWTEFFLLMPADPPRGNRRLFYGVNNRGNKLALGAFNNRGGNDPAPGNGFLMRQGYSILWCGWNGDALPGNGRLQIGLPVATRDGETITGRIHAEITVNRKAYSQPFYWGNSNPYPTVSLDNSGATLTRRPRRDAEPIEIPRDQWSFARWNGRKAAPDPKHLTLKEGFRPGWLYDLVYTGRDPRVTGLGFVAVRDACSFFRYAKKDNPLAGALERAYVFGISQSARFIHHFLFEGFNADEKGRIVFDGAMPHVGGGGKGQFNYRFAQTTRHGSQHEDLLYPSDFFPFNTMKQKDPVTGRTGDTFARSRAKGRLPRIFFTETSTEYWARAASLLHTDVDGKKDSEIDPNVRIYHIAGGQHGVSSSPRKGMYRNFRNTLDYRPVLRALLVALDAWVTHGQAPPPSVVPRIADGTLVGLDAWKRGFPAIPGTTLPDAYYVPFRLDPGPRWHTEGLADHVPPKIGAPFRTLVPAVDRDGNEAAGIRMPGVSVPLATYAGWNLRAPAYGAEGALARWSGSQWPFARTKEERVKSGDPRPSIRERYPTRDSYLSKVTNAVLGLRRRRLILEEDAVRILEAAAKREIGSD